MSTSTTTYLLKLGHHGFFLDDLPEELPFGGEQSTAVRKFPGGRIHIQTLGSFDSPITWQGDFLGDGAFYRAQLINNMRIAGDEYLLKFGSISKYVVITNFVMKYRNNSNVGYEVTVQPVGKSLQSISAGSPPVRKSSHMSSKYNSSSESSSKTPIQTTKKSSGPSTRYHIVKKGDALWNIAHYYYGSGAEWPKIAKANPKVNPKNMKVGTKLVIPY